VPTAIVKLMLLLKIQSLSYGHSGIQLQTVELISCFTTTIFLPVILYPRFIRASGDLAFSNNLSLPLLEGEVNLNAKKVHSSVIMERFNWEPLQSKEGLALLNGTHL
jgi:histidine ammonia-lyase